MSRRNEILTFTQYAEFEFLPLCGFLSIPLLVPGTGAIFFDEPSLSYLIGIECQIYGPQFALKYFKSRFS
jgi:hypothetical protein